jgi:uncharacterized membrane protein YeaQ/YmgE (transglycosylase-associated protein family)
MGHILEPRNVQVNRSKGNLVIVVVFVILIGFVFTIFPIPIDYSGLPINGTGQPTKIAAQTVPTLVNGITTMVGIVVTISGILFGILLRDGLKGDDKERENTFGVLGLLLIPLGYLFVAYGFLTSGLFEYAVKWSISGFLVVAMIILIFYRTYAERMNLGKTEKTESDKPKPDESKTADKNKNVSKDAYKEAVKELVNKAQQKKSFWKGLLYGVFLGIVGNMLASHYFEVFKDLTSWQFDSLFLPNIIALVVFSVVVAISTFKMWQSITKMDDFLKFVEETKKKYHLDDNFNEVKGKSD